MKKRTIHYIESILKDYPDIDGYIKRRVEELKIPYREPDVNSGIKGNSQNDQMSNLMITIEQDSRIAALERNKRVLARNLEECDEDTRLIIKEVYMRRYQKKTIDYLYQNHLLSCGRSKAFELRNAFFENVAKDLGLDI